MFNEYEKQHNLVSYKRLFNYFFENSILCNDIKDLDLELLNDNDNLYSFEDFKKEFKSFEDISNTYYYDIWDFEDFNNINDLENSSIFENIQNIVIDELDIYQYFIVDFNKYDKVDILQHFILYYCSELDLYIVAVDHYGTNWDYILTNVSIKDFKNSNF